MRNYWLVARHEYRNMVMKRSFILETLAIPLGLALIIGLTILVETMGDDERPLGYVDYSGLLVEGRQAELFDPEDRVEIIAYESEAQAQTALEAGENQAYFVFPADYPANMQFDIYYMESPPDNSPWRDFDDFVRLNLVAELPADVQTRLLDGVEVTVIDTTSNRTFNEENALAIALPIFGTFFFIFATMSAAGYLLGAVANEKENRTMEVMLTSITPAQMIGGKVAGLLAGALTQLGIYVAAAYIGLQVATNYIQALQMMSVPWGYLGLMALFFLPSYALIAAIMVAIGSAVTELQQAQQVAGILNLFFMAPLFLMPIFFTSPNHPIAIGMTLFPTTAFLTVSLRWAVGTIPMWQLAGSWIILVATGALLVWVATRIFRAGMLQYGQPMKFKSALVALRGG